MKKNLLFAEDVAREIGVSDYTLKLWYRFKKENPDNEYAKLLPEVQRIEPRNKRCWKKSDLKALLKFKDLIPHGRNGVLGSVTQRYYKKQEENIYE